MRMYWISLVGLALTSLASAGTCPEGFAAILARPAAAKVEAKVFDLATFEKAKEFFAGKLGRGEQIQEGEIRALGLSRPALALALSEVAAARAGTSLGLRISFLGPEGEVKRQERALARLRVDREFGWDDIEDFVEDYYATVNRTSNPYPSLPRWLAVRLPEPRKEILRERLQKTIWAQDLTRAAESLGLLRAPGMVAKFDRFLHRHPNLGKTVVSAGLNAFSMTLTYAVSGFPMPFHIPRFRLVKALEIDPALVERARREGFDAIYPELKARYGKLALFDTAWSAARTTVYRATLAYVVYVVNGTFQDHPYLKDPRFWTFLFKFNRAKEEDAERLHRERCDLDRLRREDFIQFRDAFNLDEGPFEEPLPNPWDTDFEERVTHFPAQYRLEAEDTWRLALAKGPKEFKCPEVER